MMLSALSLMLGACGDSKKDYDATGVFEATETTVSAENNGRLLRFSVEEGSSLSAGQQVGLIDTVQLQLRALRLGATRQSYATQRPDVAAQIAATRQQLAKARQERERARLLVADGAANTKTLDDADNEVKVISRQLAALESTLGNSTESLNSQMSATDMERRQVMDQLAKCHIVAPVSGVVMEKYAEPGEYASVGRPLFKMADTHQMFLRAYVTSAQLAKVKLGQRVTVFSDYGTGTRRTCQGRVTWISPRSEFTPKTILTDDERADLVYAVKVAVVNDGYLKIGMYGEVKL